MVTFYVLKSPSQVIRYKLIEDEMRNNKKVKEGINSSKIRSAKKKISCTTH